MTIRRVFAVAVVAMALVPIPVVGHRASGQPAPRLNRVWPLQDLGVLNGSDRDRWQKPDRIMDALGVADGSVVAQLGANGGWFTIRLARRVGPNGLVYAEDTRQEMLAAILRRARGEGLTNVRTVAGGPSDPDLPFGRLDAVLIAGGYASLQDPAAHLAAARRALRPRGRLGIVEFRMDGGGPGPPLHERVDADQIIRDAGRAGLQLVDQEDFLDFQHLLIFSP